jgi:Uncharacterized protein involved in biosynthesis of c-type cytochromes
MKYFFLFLIFFITLSNSLFSDERLNIKITKNLRCLVCQGQSVADSNSEFALTIKSVVKDKVNEGLSEGEIYKFLSDKYGDWILYDPPFKAQSILLWILPYLSFLAGAIILFYIIKKNVKT